MIPVGPQTYAGCFATTRPVSTDALIFRYGSPVIVDIASGLLSPWKMRDTPGEGTGPTGTGIPVGRVPPPGDSGSSKFHSLQIPKSGLRGPEPIAATA